MDKRKFVKEDIEPMLDVVFKKYDENNDGFVSSFQFPTILQKIVDMIGAEIPTVDEANDIFDNLDMNGDQKLDRN